MTSAHSIEESLLRKKRQSSGGLTFALQALLNRHESYVTESQLEHARLTAQITGLEADRLSLQSANEKIVAENRDLLSRLEEVNYALQTSDAQVEKLEALFQECEAEVKRLNILGSRAEELEVKILDLEKERAVLTRKVEDSENDNRNTYNRWRASEIRVRQLEIELQKIEWEARQEKERHEGVVARLERERTLERELGSAEGRLKGAAAMRGLSSKRPNTNVVSHFVRDILQDNATLQVGIAELRELLQASNEEVQNLREQVLLHQPVVEWGIMEPELSRSMPLDEEPGWNQSSSPKQVQQEVHVHHHYHAKIANRRERTSMIRKTPRRRALLGIGMLPSTPESSDPSSPVSAPLRRGSSPALPIQLHHPQTRRNRWSLQSSATATTAMSSLPSSPRSFFDYNSSIFDCIDTGEEESRPTSPESAAGFSSPLYNPKTRRDPFSGRPPDPLEEAEEDDVGVTSAVLEEIADEPETQGDHEPEISSLHSDQTPKPSQLLIPNKGLDPSVLEPQPPDPEPDQHQDPPPAEHNSRPGTSLQPASPEPADPLSPAALSRQTLHRTSSHDSLVSISGMDIHLANHRPSKTSAPLLRAGNRSYFALSPPSTRTITASQPLASVTEYTANSFHRPSRADSAAATQIVASPNVTTRNISTSLEALTSVSDILGSVPRLRNYQQQLLLPPTPLSSSSSSSITTAPTQTNGLGSRFGTIGGWVRDKWGIGPAKSVNDLCSTASSSPSSPFSPSELQQHQLHQYNSGIFTSRAPGINQRGPIPGLWAPSRAPIEVHAKVLDVEGLQESLAE